MHTTAKASNANRMAGPAPFEANLTGHLLCRAQILSGESRLQSGEIEFRESATTWNVSRGGNVIRSVSAPASAASAGSASRDPRGRGGDRDRPESYLRRGRLSTPNGR